MIYIYISKLSFTIRGDTTLLDPFRADLVSSCALRSLPALLAGDCCCGLIHQKIGDWF